MPRPARGSVVERKTKSGTVYALRFRALGRRQYLTLGGGNEEDGDPRARAEAELRHVLADVERGIWRAARARARRAAGRVPTFHEFASEWLAANAPRLGSGRERSTDYEWALSHHLLPLLRRLPAHGDHRRGGRSLQGGEAPRGQSSPRPRSTRRSSGSRRSSRSPRSTSSIPREPGPGARRRVKVPKAAAQLGRARAAARAARGRDDLHAARCSRHCSGAGLRVTRPWRWTGRT